MQRHGGIVVTCRIRWVVAVIESDISIVVVPEHWFWHVRVCGITIHVDSDVGEGFRDLTNCLTFSGNNFAIVAAGACPALVYQIIIDGRNGRCQIAIF